MWCCEHGSSGGSRARYNHEVGMERKEVLTRSFVAMSKSQGRRRVNARFAMWSPRNSLET
jgi:hypothetical protein